MSGLQGQQDAPAAERTESIVENWPLQSSRLLISCHGSWSNSATACITHLSGLCTCSDLEPKISIFICSQIFFFSRFLAVTQLTFTSVPTHNYILVHEQMKTRPGSFLCTEETHAEDIDFYSADILATEYQCSLFFSPFHSEQAQAVDRDVVPRGDHREHRRRPAGSAPGGPRQGRPRPLRRYDA